ncbi:MAG: DUF1629 domain-containing protein [Rhodothermales bacterium]
MAFAFWKTRTAPGTCTCTALQGFDEEHRIAYAQPVADRFPSDTSYKMSDERPNDIQLADAIANRDNYLLVSPALRAFLEAEGGARAEFLPTQILNHKGRVASDEYVIVNVLDVHDAIDLDRSEVKWNNIDPDKISWFDELVLDEERIPADCRMLRLQHFTNRLLVREDLADEIRNQGFTGVSFVATEGFTR